MFDEKLKNVVGSLNRLQESYIQIPQYTTVKKHIEESKEAELVSGGVAKILTNSLAFDSDPDTIKEIMANLINGAKYIYYMPYTPNLLNELSAYVAQCRIALSAIKVTDLKERTIPEILTDNLEFKVFREDIYCSYNFAHFTQLSTKESDWKHFIQGWWYINPRINTEINFFAKAKSDGEHIEASPMIANEVVGHDIRILAEFFRVFDSCCCELTGQLVIDTKADDLDDKIEKELGDK